MIRLPVAPEQQPTAPAQIAINWLRQKNARVIPILGARKLEQLEGCLGALTFHLDEAQMKRLD